MITIMVDDDIEFEKLLNFMMFNKYYELINVNFDLTFFPITVNPPSVSILLCFFAGSPDSDTLIVFSFFVSFIFFYTFQ